MCLLKELYWSTLVHQHRQKHQGHHKHTCVMLRFIHFCLMTANRMLSQIFHTEKASLNFLSNAELCIIR